MESVSFSGHDCTLLENNSLRLLVTRSIGPRILLFGFRDGKNMFAELPHFVTECPGMGTFRFYGGHRLWHAPENLCRTYQPDDSPVDITPLENGVLVAQDVETRTGLRKSIEICLQGDDSRVTITHRLTNYGLWDVPCAPWAITQFKTGGVAVLPQVRQETGVLPNRSLALWDYTDMSNPNILWGKNHILVRAEMQAPFKVGFPNPRGWLAYWLDGTLFVKRAKYDPQSAYYDFGSSSECYCNDQFLELETLAPIQKIEPKGTTVHIETWELHRNVDQPQGEADVYTLIEKLKLE